MITTLLRFCIIFFYGWIYPSMMAPNMQPWYLNGENQFIPVLLLILGIFEIRALSKHYKEKEWARSTVSFSFIMLYFCGIAIFLEDLAQALCGDGYF